MSFPQHAHERLHPTQLYEAAGALILFAFLWFFVRPRKRAHGQVSGALLLTYGVLRFGLEFLRDDARGGSAGLSTSQWLSVPMSLLGVVLLARTSASISEHDAGTRASALITYIRALRYGAHLREFELPSTRNESPSRSGLGYAGSGDATRTVREGGVRDGANGPLAASQ
jgi:hypothetical protein